MAPNLTELKAASRGKNPTGRNRRVRGLEWKRLSHPSGPPGTTLGGTVLNYVTIFQPQEFFTEAVLLSFCQPEKGTVGTVKEKGRG